MANGDFPRSGQIVGVTIGGIALAAFLIWLGLSGYSFEAPVRVAVSFLIDSRRAVSGVTVPARPVEQRRTEILYSVEGASTGLIGWVDSRYLTRVER